MYLVRNLCLLLCGVSFVIGCRNVRGSAVLPAVQEYGANRLSLSATRHKPGPLVSTETLSIEQVDTNSFRPSQYQIPAYRGSEVVSAVDTVRKPSAAPDSGLSRQSSSATDIINVSGGVIAAGGSILFVDQVFGYGSPTAGSGLTALAILGILLIPVGGFLVFYKWKETPGSKARQAQRAAREATNTYTRRRKILRKVGLLIMIAGLIALLAAFPLFGLGLFLGVGLGLLGLGALFLAFSINTNA